MLRVSVNESREMRAVVLALKQSDRVIQSQIRKNVRGELAPEFTKSMREHANTRLEHRVLADTARVQVSNQNVTLRTAHVGRALSGGMSPKQGYPAVEFGADREAKRTVDQTSQKGKYYRATKRTRVQFRPRNKRGYVFYPTVNEMVPRFAALYAQTVVRTFAEALEGKSNA